MTVSEFETKWDVEVKIDLNYYFERPVREITAGVFGRADISVDYVKERAIYQVDRKYFDKQFIADFKKLAKSLKRSEKADRYNIN
jgi:hypothetical protein